MTQAFVGAFERGVVELAQRREELCMALGLGGGEKLTSVSPSRKARTSASEDIDWVLMATHAPGMAV